MKKHTIIVAFLTVLSIKSYSQIVFENGYFINESNQKINCLIKNIDWKNNPSEFEYKISQDEPIQNADIQKVKEFGITGISKYIRAKVNIDRSIDNVDKLSTESKPAFREEVLFLKVLIEGKASLFQYEDGSLLRFFYSLNDSALKQLVYKRYLINQNIGQNNFFRQQLLFDLKCQGIKSSDVKNIKYSKRELTRIFLKYNECVNSSYINFEPTQKKDLFNLSFRPGLNYSSLTIYNLWDSWIIDFDNEINFRLGIEAEFILPFNKNKWSIIIEPTYQYYKSEQSKKMSSFSGQILVSKVDYKSIELPVGVRHYFYLNDKSKLFANISFVFDFPKNSSIKYSSNYYLPTSYELQIKSRRNRALGVGYKYKNRFSFEMRRETSREISGDYLFWRSEYKTLSIIFAYTIF